MGNGWSAKRREEGTRDRLGGTIAWETKTGKKGDPSRSVAEIKLGVLYCICVCVRFDIGLQELSIQIQISV